MLGGLLALCSAACFAFNNASVRRAVLTGSIAQGMAITVPLGVPLFFLAALITGNLAAVLGFSPTALAALAAAGIMHFVWGRYCNYRATRAIGTNLVAPVQQVNLLVTLVLAIWLLGEYLTPLKILGIALILLGPTFAMQKKRRRRKMRAVSDEKITPIDAEKPAAFQPKYAEGYTFSLLSATGYGLSPVLIRIGLENQGVGVALAGGLVAYIAATAVFALVLLWPGQWKHVWSDRPRGREVVHVLGLPRVLLADVPLHGDVDRAGDGGVADQPAVDPVPAVLQPAAQSATRGVRRRRCARDRGLARGRGAAVAEHRSRAVGAAAAGDVVTLLNWRWP